MFYTGLFLGIASTLVVLFVVMFASGMSLTRSGVNAYNPPTPSPSPSPSPSPLPAPSGQLAPVDESRDHILGNKNAKVTLIEYSDFECPYCERHNPTLKAILQQYPQDVRLVYRHYPLSFHPNAQKAAEASECAGKQGKFWEMHDKIFEANPSGLSVAVYKRLAGEIGLNQGQFDSCLDSGEMAARVAEDIASGNDAGVSGTPATFVNGSLVEGAVPLAQFQSAVQAAGAAK